jgi:hypothetical protein
MYFILWGVLINGLIIDYLIMEVPSAKELVQPTPSEFMQIFTYGKRFTAILMLTLLTLSLIASLLSYHEDKKARPKEIPYEPLRKEEQQGEK